MREKKKKEKRYGVCDIESVREVKGWKEINEKNQEKRIQERRKIREGEEKEG